MGARQVARIINAFFTKTISEDEAKLEVANLAATLLRVENL